MNTTSRLMLFTQRSGLRVPIRSGPTFAKGSFVRWNISSPQQSFHRRESSNCSSSAKTSSILPQANQQHASASIDDNIEKKACCHSQSATTVAANKTFLSHSSLSITSRLFWSDPTTWRTASTNTFRCLVGCTLGDMSMLFYLQSFHPTLSPGIAMALAMGSGIMTSISLETVLLRFSKLSNMSWKAALKTATGMSLISMLTMEAVENAVDYHLMGWGNVNLTDPVFWRAVGLSALAGWSAPLPFNYWNLKRHGKSCH
ncbi:hypothetical protein EDD21DRAFT_393831 [Dissophora ornata]|nr:hypothetical protein EDD21DRAFT_393831 [Dissophora ornata]